VPATPSTTGSPSTYITERTVMNRNTAATPQLENLKSISELARDLGRPKRTLARRLAALLATDAAGQDDWLVGKGHEKRLVNLSLLAKRHPEVLTSSNITPAQHEEWQAQVRDLKDKLSASRVEVRTFANKLRRMEEIVRQLTGLVLDYSETFDARVREIVELMK
jgi:hypothetical protein